MKQQRSYIILCAMLCLFLLAGCRSNKETATGHPIKADEVTVVEAFARAAIPGSDNSAVYMTIVNGLDESVTLVSVQTSVADSSTLHETVRDENNVVRMADLSDGVSIPSNEAALLEPGGMHIMLENLQADLVSGSEIELTLNFDSAKSQTVQVPVQDRDGMLQLVETLDALSVSEMHAIDEALGDGKIESDAVEQIQDFTQEFDAVDWSAVAGAASVMEAVNTVEDTLPQLESALAAGDTDAAKPFAKTIHDVTHDLVEKVTSMQKLESDDHEHNH